MLDATPLMRLYGRYRTAQLDREDPVAAQSSVLRRLVARAAGTGFGRDHNFAAIRDVAEFQQRVPLRRFEDTWAAYWQPSFPDLVNVTWPGRIPYFALTSGTTTGATKHIPVSTEMVGANKRAAADILVQHLAACPRSRLLAGDSLMLSGSTALRSLAPGVRGGDLSGIAAFTMPWWARLRTFNSAEIERMDDWEQKIRALLPLMRDADIRSISGTPSWLLLFFEMLTETWPGADDTLAAVFPRLELLIHGGISFAPYRHRFAGLLADTPAETREVYAASEAFVAVADRGDGEGLRLITDNGVFYEFVPAEELDAPTPTRHWLATVEPGVNYAIVVSTCAGLWGHIIGDTVRVLEGHPPRLLITGRTAYMLSAFGEHLIAEEIEEAVAAAARSIGADISDYTVGAVFDEQGGPSPGAAGGHLFIVEFSGRIPEPSALEAFATHVDSALADTNEDYRAHRAGDFGMRTPRIHVVSPGTFAHWMRERGQLGGQHKVPRILTDEAQFAALRAFTGDERA